MDQLPKNYFIYHFSYALPKFIKSRPSRLAKEAKFLNILSLLKNIFAPYRRLTLSKKESLFNRISFSLISRGIGFFVRLILIIFGLIVLFIFAFVFIIQIFLYIPPIASLPDYFLFRRYTFFEYDLKNPKKYVSKLEKTAFFKSCKLFFDSDFIKLFDKLPSLDSLGISANQNHEEMFAILATKWPDLKNYLSKRTISSKDLTVLTTYLNEYYINPAPSNPAPLGYKLIYGYTNTLDSYCRELTNQKVTSPFFNKDLTEKMESVFLRKSSNNVLMIGDVGVGRHSGVIDLASAVTRRQLPSQNDKRILLMDTIALMSSSHNLIEIKNKFERVLEEAKHAGNIILVIDYIDKISSTLDGRIDLSDVLTSTLTDDSLPIVGITTYDEYNKYIRVNPAFLNLFEKVEIAEPQNDQILQVLIGKTLEMHSKYKMSATYQALLEIAEKSQRLIADKNQPENSIILLEDCLARATKLNKKLITIDIVDEILTEKTKIPVGKIKESEIEKLKDLEGFLHKKIVGQDTAIVAIAKAMRRSRTGLEKGKRPMGSFLFLGPTGVGKTETAKALADAFFGAESKMIRLDMTEFKAQGSTNRLIGDTKSKTPGQLVSLVRQNPYGLLLLDEFEKANPFVQNLFLQILDEGSIKDAFGKTVSFTNIILIATSNAGAEFIREQVNKNLTSNLSDKLIEYTLSKGLFNPELINRFDSVVVYQPLTHDQVEKVASLMLQRLAKQLKDTKNITLQINDQLAKAVAQKGYNLQFGARPIRRLIQDDIEDGLAKLIIDGQLKNGDSVSSQTLLKFIS